MNNKRILIVGVLAAIVTLMVGYALFSETITINGTATAKGDFSLETNCVKGITNEYLNYDSDYRTLENSQGGYENDYCTVSGSTVSFGADLLYPGALRYYTVKIKNTGSIDAVLNTSSGIEENTGTACMDTDNDGIFETCYDNTNSEYEGFYSYVGNSAFFAGDTETLIFDSNGNEVYNERTPDDENMTLKPGDTFYIVLQNKWHSDFTPETNKLYLKYTGASMKFNFKQVSN